MTKLNMRSLKRKNLVFLGLGANLRSLSHTSIRKLLLNSIKRLNYIGLRVQKSSYFLSSSPMPFTSGPIFINCVFKCLIILCTKLIQNVSRKNAYTTKNTDIDNQCKYFSVYI